MFVWIIFVVLIFMLIGGAPAWPHSKEWGYGPTGIIALLLIVFLCLWVFGGLSSMGHQGWWGEHSSMMHQ